MSGVLVLEHAGIKYVQADAGASLDQAYEYVLVDATTAPVNLTLPSASSAAWQQMTIKRVDVNAAHNVLIRAQAPDTIAGQADHALLPNDPIFHIYSNGHVWLTV